MATYYKVYCNDLNLNEDGYYTTLELALVDIKLTMDTVYEPWKKLAEILDQEQDYTWQNVCRIIKEYKLPINDYLCDIFIDEFLYTDGLMVPKVENYFSTFKIKKIVDNF